MISKTGPAYEVGRAEEHWLIRFSAMASPCEVLIRCNNRSDAEDLASLSFAETKRIEQKFSRYRDDNIVYEINNSDGAAIEVDEEMARLLDYADHIYKLSGGLFDITSGVLRRAWRFDGSRAKPDNALIKSLLAKVGWDKVSWDGKNFGMLPGMEIDLGGVGKEYAVDLVAEMLHKACGLTLMVNFGGDIRAITADIEPVPWVVGVENPKQEKTAVGQINLTNGGVATSGDLRRFCMVDGVRLGHILNPRTGWPVSGAPRSVTVIGNYCVEAGLLATLAMLQGPEAEKFLEEQDAPCHCIR